MVQKNIIESSGHPQLVKEATPTVTTDKAALGVDERHQLKSRIYQLESEVRMCTVYTYKIPYSRKFRGVKFLQKGHLQIFRDLIFAHGHSIIEIV